MSWLERRRARALLVLAVPRFLAVFTCAACTSAPDTVVSSHVLHAHPETATCSAAPDFHPPDHTLVFADEFDGAALDRDAWCTRYAYGGGPPLQVADEACTGPGGHGGTLDFLNDEQQRYVDFNQRGEAMHVLRSGTLQLRLTKTRDDSYASYESAMLRSKRTFAPDARTDYYLTARVRLPRVQGTWPALWLASSWNAAGQTAWPPEIDLFEGALNGVEDRENMLRLGAQVRGGKQTASGAQEITFASAFDRTWGNHHAPRSLRDTWLEIGAAWTAESVCYFIDGARIMCERYRWLTDAGEPAPDASLLLNLAAGGAWAGRHGIADLSLPTALEVDHVRIYARESASDTSAL